VIESRILLVRGQRVLTDSDLAELYGVPTKALNQAVKRNQSRFPEDFMFRLTLEEGRYVEILRSQTVTLENTEDGNRPLRSQTVTLERRGRFRKYAPIVFTEHGIAMLSSVLSSERAILVNIAIVRTFIRLRDFLASHQEVAGRLEQLEWRQTEQAGEIRKIFETMQELVDGPEDLEPKRRIGFPLGAEQTA
jgi:hypothetical protein